MFATNSKKTSVLGFFIFAVVVAIIWGCMYRNTPTENTAIASTSPAIKTVLPVTKDEAAAVGQPSNTKLDAVPKAQRLLDTPAEAAEVNEWFRKHGRFDTDDDYASYDQNTLESLAANGDIQAMHALSKMYLDPAHIQLPQYGFNGADRQLKNAAVHGSTQAFTELAISHEIRFYSNERDPAAKRAAGLEVMSLYKAQELRGDRWASLNQAVDLKRSLQPTSTEQEIINKRAQQIIDELQQKRIELGLGNFDNSVPDVVTKFFNNVEKQPI